MAMEGEQSEVALGVIFVNYSAELFDILQKCVYLRKLCIEGKLVVTISDQ
jgi:hypothetical protein